MQLILNCYKDKYTCKFEKFRLRYFHLEWFCPLCFKMRFIKLIGAGWRWIFLSGFFLFLFYLLFALCPHLCSLNPGLYNFLLLIKLEFSYYQLHWIIYSRFELWNVHSFIDNSIFFEGTIYFRDKFCYLLKMPLIFSSVFGLYIPTPGTSLDFLAMSSQKDFLSVL